MKHISARDFLIVGTKNLKQDGLRVRKSFQKLPQLPTETRDRLRSEFLEIVCNRSESYGCRNQAISALGLWSGPLNAVGRTDISKTLLELLNTEFLADNKPMGERQSHDCRQCKGAELTFLKGILRAILLIHPKDDWIIPRKVYELELLKGTDLNAWFNKLTKKTKPKGDNNDTSRFEMN